MNFAKKLLAVLALLPGLAFANEGGFPLDRAPDRERHGLAAKRRQAVRQLLPELPFGVGRCATTACGTWA
jgi:hypothetical protein